jgi:hypothetical protein
MRDDELDRWERYLYEQHSKASLAEWAPTLRFFRYCRAYGGHVGDGDALRVTLRFESRSDLEGLLAHFGIPLQILPAGAPRPVPGKAYPADEFRSFRSTVDRFPDIIQPGHTSVLGVPAFVWVQDSRMTIDSTGENVWEVDDTAIASARRLEPLLEPLAARVLDPPQDDRHCICPKHYPELWGSPGQ